MIHTGSFLPSAGFGYSSSIPASRDRPTAVIAGGIGMLPGVLRAIQACRLRIPAEISVVGTGDSDLADLYTPPISLQRWDHAEVGRIAAGLLLDRILGRTGPEARHVVLPNEFVARESTRPAPSL